MTKQAKLLKETLSKYLNWNEARLKLLSLLLVALLEVQTVNLMKLSKVLGDKATAGSGYRRLQRFFKDYEMDETDIAKLITAQFDGGKWVLTIEPIEWLYGGNMINILTLAIVQGEVAIPILSKLLEDEKKSSISEHIELIEKFIKIFGASQINYVTGKRELTEGDWIKYLQESEINYCLRIQYNALITEEEQKTNEKFAKLAVGEHHYIGECQVYGQRVNLAVTRLNKKDLLLVTGKGDPTIFIDDYKKGWDSETLLDYFKTQGFHFEDTHLSVPERIYKMFLVLSIAFVWIYKDRQFV